MIETRAWDTGILYVRTTHDGWEVRIGVLCLLFLVWLAVRIIRRLAQEDGPKITT